MSKERLTIGVFGGSFNPIHLGHALLAITTQQTKPVDSVVLVPVYKHAVKRDLLPFEDRLEMCRLAVPSDMVVSRIEQEVGESNGAMLRGLKATYPPGTKFLWIVGDDFFRWWQKPKGLETLKEVDGLIVQRRLHKAVEAENRFYKEPIDEGQIRAVANTLGLELDFIYGELPHFSSTLVRRAPGNWRSFLPHAVVTYLNDRPHLLKQLSLNLEADAERERGQLSLSETPTTIPAAATCIMWGLDAVHFLQLERGHLGMCLSTGTGREKLEAARRNTDALIQEILGEDHDFGGLEEVMGLAAELQQIPVWLNRDRLLADRRCEGLVSLQTVEGWSARILLVDKFNPRIDVLIAAIIRAITEISSSTSGDGLPDLLLKWSDGKEALGRLRAFVCAGGQKASALIRQSIRMRQRVHQRIENKERRIARVLELQAGMRRSTPDALYGLLQQVTVSEFSLMGCFSSSTPLTLVHKLLASGVLRQDTDAFDVFQFFEASSSAIDFLLTFAKALAASACAGA